MLRTCNRFVGALVLVLVVLGPTERAWGQRERGRPEVRGVIKAVDAGAGTISVSAVEGRNATADKSYSLAKDVEVVVGDGNARRSVFKAAKLTDLTAGVVVSLVLSADEKLVESIAAEGPTIRGLIKSVDLKGKVLTVTLFPSRREEVNEEKSYTLADGVEIALDDGRGRRFSVKEGKLSDLSSGLMVALRLSLDQKQAQSVLAEGANLFGTVKAVDASRNTITLAINSGRGLEGEEKVLEVAADTGVLLDDGRGRRLSVKEGKLADVPVGSTVGVKLSPDQKVAALLRVEGPGLPAMLRAVDAAKGTVTILTGPRDNPEEKTFPVAKDARISVDGKDSKLADLKVDADGPFVFLRLTLDQKAVQLLQARTSR